MMIEKVDRKKTAWFLCQSNLSTLRSFSVYSSRTFAKKVIFLPVEILELEKNSSVTFVLETLLKLNFIYY